jgi:hypothetical protein
MIFHMAIIKTIESFMKIELMMLVAMIEQVFELTRTRSSGGGQARVSDAGNLAQPLELHIPASRM